jgi:hypothetical protein
MGKVISVVPVLDEVTADTTSVAVPIEGASKVVLVCKRADHDGGSSAFTATVSVDGSNYIDYKKWISNANNGNDEGLTRVTTLTLSADGVDFLTMDPYDGFKDIKVEVDETTSGTHSAWLYIEY